MKLTSILSRAFVLLNTILLFGGCEANASIRSNRPRGGSTEPEQSLGSSDVVGKIMQRYEGRSVRSNRKLGGGNGKGGKGGKGYSSYGKGYGKGGKGKGSGSGAGWSDGEYYGCLMLSEDEMYEMETHGHEVDCDYTVHAVEISNGTTYTSSSAEYAAILSGEISEVPSGQFSSSSSYQSSEYNGEEGEQNSNTENEQGNSNGDYNENA